MRQLAMIVIMAQMGSYVPAEVASLPIFDAIFTRIGAADDLVSGQSTFMVEMMEANRAIRQASERSLILLMNWDGGLRLMMGWLWRKQLLSIFLVTVPRPRLFLQPIIMRLTDLSSSLTRLENVHVATLEKMAK